MNRYLNYFILLVINWLLLLTFSFAVDLQINNVKVIGNQRISSEYIESLLSFKDNQPYTQESLNNDLKKLYATELFKIIDTKIENKKLTLIVKESPLIDTIEFNGNNELKKDALEKEMQTKVRTTFSQNKLNLDIQRITDLYYKSGYLNAGISYNIQKQDNNRIKLIINITEGEKTTIYNISFIGNNHFLDSELKGILLSSEHKWWKFFSAGDIYDASKVMYDNELLRQFYLEKGYPNFAVTSNFTELDMQHGFVLTYVVDEGERYKFGYINLKIELDELKDQEYELEQTLNIIQFGEWYQASKLNAQARQIKDKINELGYQFVAVEPSLVYNDLLKRVDVVFKVHEVKHIFVNKINITGNQRTLDYVIRREIEFSEKDSYDSDSIGLSKRNLSRTGYFSNVILSDTPTDQEDVIDVNVDVEEVSTGSINVGGGYSTIDKLQFEASYSESNFMGTGRVLGVNLSLSSVTNIYSFSLSDPYFLGKELYSSIYVYRKDSGADDYYDNSLYQNIEQGISLSTGYNLTNDITQRWGYNFFYRNIYDVDPESSLSIQQIAGTSFISSLSHTITYDTRDSALFPTKGLKTDLYTEYAGIFGDTYYIKNTLTAVWYKELLEDVVFSSLGSMGIIEGLNGQEVSVIDKYLLGGPTLRGFQIGVNYGGIGPVDKTTGESLGGKYMLRGSLQIETPIPGVEQYGLLVYIFDDFGTVTDFSNDENIIDTASIRMSVGFGLSWRSPAGIISLDVGFPVLKEPTDATERIFLNFGTRV